MDSSMMNWLPVVGVFIAFAGLMLDMRRINRANLERLDKKLDELLAGIKSDMAEQLAQFGQRIDPKDRAAEPAKSYNPQEFHEEETK